MQNAFCLISDVGSHRSECLQERGIRGDPCTVCQFICYMFFLEHSILYDKYSKFSRKKIEGRQDHFFIASENNSEVNGEEERHPNSEKILHNLHSKHGILF